MPPEALEFIDAEGGTTDLSTEVGYLYKNGITERFMPPVLAMSGVVPEQDGAVFRSMRFDVRAVTLPLTVEGDTRLAVRQRVAALAQGLNPKKGLGRLRVTREDGVSRELICLPSFGSNETADEMAEITRAVAGFDAFDPYWYDTTATSYSWTTGEEPGSFFPILPLVLSSSTVFAQPTIDNDGDAEAWPVWTITGPGADLTLRNNTTGKTLTLDYTLSAGQTLEIDTRRGYKTVTVDGVSVFSDLTGSLWSLPTGSSSISVEMNGTDADTTVGLAYSRRWIAV